jgi:hypothetical protein
MDKQVIIVIDNAGQLGPRLANMNPTVINSTTSGMHVDL